MTKYEAPSAEAMRDGRDADEPKRSPELAALLIAAGAPVAPADMDWSRLQQRVADVGTVSLLRRRRGAPWWAYAASWSGMAIPIGVAAAILALVVALRAPVADAAFAVTDTAIASANEPVMYRAIAVGARPEELMDRVVVVPTRDSLLGEVTSR